MNKRAVTLGPVFLVHSAEIGQALQAKQKDYPHLPDPTQIEVDINILNDEGGIPVVVGMNGQDLHALFLYTPSYMLELREKKAQNGYYIERIEPVNVQMYDRLAQGALSLSATRWHLCAQEMEIPNSQSSHWQLLTEEWRLLQEQVQQMRSLATQKPPVVSSSAAFPPQHERSLELAASLIEITHQLASAPDDKKRDDGAASAQRAALSLLKEGKAANPYLLAALADHHYQSYEVTTDPLHSEALSSEQEEVVRKGLSVPDLLLVHAAAEAEQVQAVGALAALIRACCAKRQHVLLTARSQQALQTLLAQLPAELFIVHLQKDGHSTTNTRSYSLKEQARQIRQRLLERTEATLPPLARLAASKSTIDQWVECLHHQMMVLSNDEGLQQIPALRRRMIEIEQFISAPFRPVLTALATAVQQAEENLTSQQQRLNTVNERHAAAEELRQKPAIGLLLNSVESLGQNWLKRQQALAASLQTEYDTRKQEYEHAQKMMQQAVYDDPEYAWCQQRIQEIETERATALTEATKAASILQETLRELVPEQPSLQYLESGEVARGSAEVGEAEGGSMGEVAKEAGEIEAQRGAAGEEEREAGEAQPSPLPYPIGNELMLGHYLNWYTLTRTLLEQQHDLLQEWWGQLSKHVERLYPELVRYADVVCGSISDIAATKELEQVEFDLVIVADTACMTLPDLLPSLVRGRRAVLVGNAEQGSPFDKQTVQRWLQKHASEEQLDDEREQEIIMHLTYSVFEHLWSELMDSANSMHTVRLTTHDENQGSNLAVSLQRGDKR